MYMEIWEMGWGVCREGEMNTREKKKPRCKEHFENVEILGKPRKASTRGMEPFDEPICISLLSFPGGHRCVEMSEVEPFGHKHRALERHAPHDHRFLSDTRYAQS